MVSSNRTPVISLFPLLFVSILLAGCGATAAAPARASALPLAAAHPTAYSARYQVRGSSAGSATAQVTTPAGGSARIAFTTTAGRVSQRATATLAGDGWSVSSVQETVDAPGQRVKIQAQPQGATMQEHAVVNGRVETPSIVLKGSWQVNAVLLVALSGVGLRPGEKGTVEDVILPHATSVPMALSVGRPVAVATPFGTMKCYPVSIGSGGAAQTAWYAVAKPHALVKYVNGRETYLLTALTP